MIEINTRVCGTLGMDEHLFLSTTIPYAFAVWNEVTGLHGTSAASHPSTAPSPGHAQAEGDNMCPGLALHAAYSLPGSKWWYNSRHLQDRVVAERHIATHGKVATYWDMEAVLAALEGKRFHGEIPLLQLPVD